MKGHSKRRRSERTERTEHRSVKKDGRTLVSSSSTTLETEKSTSRSSEWRTEESSLYVDVLIPRTHSTQSLPLAASLLEPQSGIIRCRSTQGLPNQRGQFHFYF